MTESNNWEEEFSQLPAINYNLYVGSGKSACDDCLENDEAEEQLKRFIRKTIQKEVNAVLDRCLKETIELLHKEESDNNNLFWSDGYLFGYMDSKDVINKHKVK